MAMPLHLVCLFPITLASAILYNLERSQVRVVQQEVADLSFGKYGINQSIKKTWRGNDPNCRELFPKASSMIAKLQARQKMASTPCSCEASNAEWKAPNRTRTHCVFIDLGAANGNTFDTFLQNGYGPVKNCPNGEWEAILVEANPLFNVALHKIAETYHGVTTKTSTAAYMCEATTSFYLDVVNSDRSL